jgi:hypothetical protein
MNRDGERFFTHEGPRRYVHLVYAKMSDKAAGFAGLPKN